MRSNIPNISLILTIIFGYMGQICGENIVDGKSVSIVNFRPKKNWRDMTELMLSSLARSASSIICIKPITNPVYQSFSARKNSPHREALCLAVPRLYWAVWQQAR